MGSLLLFGLFCYKVSDCIKDSKKRKHGVEDEEKDSNDSEDDDIWDKMQVVEDDSINKKTRSKSDGFVVTPCISINN